ncbi:hypothetical protein [Salinibaculum salinum]|uniref:hypothetical protein n=1 Tax=Salinibaculum salinum TaxID=3131996 RepID=UPI0030EB8FA5
MTRGVWNRLARAYADGGVSTVVDRSLQSFFAEPRGWPTLHWRLASWYYRANCANDVQVYSEPPDPFKLEWVDPAAIERHTRREYPPWRGRLSRFGEVLDGDWDQRDCPPTNPDYDGPPPELFVADRFENSVLYQSLAAHFERSVDWEETELFVETCRLLREGEENRVWQHCRSVSDVRKRFAYLDELYETIQREGFKSQRQLLRTDPQRGFRDWLRNEITVDIGRDGELLLVCGKHRLTIAKLLGVERVPVLFLVRHPGWMARRESAIESDEVESHPDLRDIPAAETAPTRRVGHAR